MIQLPNREMSIWRSGGAGHRYPKLEQDIEVDVVIIGGGICGLTTAYLLKQAGQKVAILEKSIIGGGTTGSTTGKVTSQHNLFYADFQNRFGKIAATDYAGANQKAVEEVGSLIKKEKIDCGWRRDDNWVLRLINQKRAN